MMDIMVWGALKNVLDIVRTTSLVITSMVHVTKDAMMDGLEKSATQVDNFCSQWKYFFLNLLFTEKNYSIIYKKTQNSYKISMSLTNSV